MTKIVDKNKNLIIGLLIVAIIAVFFLGSFTGQAFWSQTKTTTQALTSAQKVVVLSLLHNCQPFPQVSYTNDGTTGDELCIKDLPGSICLFVLKPAFNDPRSPGESSSNEIITNCNDKWTLSGDGVTQVTPFCCKP